jgi:hypothetical protein
MRTQDARVQDRWIRAKIPSLHAAYNTFNIQRNLTPSVNVYLGEVLTTLLPSVQLTKVKPLLAVGCHGIRAAFRKCAAAGAAACWAASRVVPEPANGSRTAPPGPASCRMIFSAHSAENPAEYRNHLCTGNFMLSVNAPLLLFFAGDGRSTERAAGKSSPWGQARLTARLFVISISTKSDLNNGCITIIE